MRGASGFIASTGSVTIGRSSYSTSIHLTAAAASASLRATTAATWSPINRTISLPFALSGGSGRPPQSGRPLPLQAILIDGYIFGGVHRDHARRRFGPGGLDRFNARV